MTIFQFALARVTNNVQPKEKKSNTKITQSVVRTGQRLESMSTCLSLLFCFSVPPSIIVSSVFHHQIHNTNNEKSEITLLIF